MSQDNNQNDRQNRQGQGDNWQGESQGQQGQGQRDDWQGQSKGDQSSDSTTRESRSSGYSESESNQGGASRQGQAPSSLPELDDTDEMDEDRDDDDRLDGSPNRRNNIG